MIVDITNMKLIWKADRALVFSDGDEVTSVLNVNINTNEITCTAKDDKGNVIIRGDDFLTVALEPKIMTIIAYKDDKIIKVYTYGAD